MDDDLVEEDWHELYFRAFDTLRFDRHFGAFGGQMPIGYGIIRRYAEDHGIVGEDFDLFETLFGMIDAEYLQREDERRPKGTGKN